MLESEKGSKAQMEKLINLNNHELQKLLFAYRSKEALANYLGVKVSDLAHIPTPSQYVQKHFGQNANDLLIEIGIMGSEARFAEYYGVSLNYVRAMKAKLVGVKEIPFKTKEFIEAEIKRLGSHKAVAIVHDITYSVFLKICKERGVSSERQAFGNSSSSKGQKAEEAFNAAYGQLLGLTPTYDDPNNKDYDFTSKKLGRIQVKAAAQNGKKGWTFGAISQHCDAVAFICYDKKFITIFNTIVFTAAELMVYLGVDVFKKKSVYLGYKQFLTHAGYCSGYKKEK